ncbi:MAG TPA: LPXTG cell wall anchor domain-containing protein [Bacillales bacterium]|nr:LPXTG cell wall anchor domain-containing protein [Bacillales bacterium]
MKPQLFKWVLLYSLITLTFVVFMPIGNTGASGAPKEIDLATDPGEYLFKIANMKPGDWADRTLTIQNKGNQNFAYTVETQRKSGSEMFYNQLMLKVSDSKGVLYEGKLGGFSGFENARPLASFSEEDLQFKITFPWESGNEFQGLATEVALKFYVEGDMPPAGNDPSGEPNDPTNEGSQPTTGGDDSSVLDSILPQTGETNPMYYYMAGFVLVMAGGALFAVKRRPDRK